MIGLGIAFCFCPEASELDTPDLTLSRSRLVTKPASRRGVRIRLALQIVVTLLVVAVPVPNVAKAVVLPLWWLATFGRLTRFEIVLYIGSCFLFAGLDVMAVREGAFRFHRPDLLGLPAYEFLLWGFYILHVRRVIDGEIRRSRSRHMLALGLAMIFALSFLLNHDSRSRFLATSVALAGALWFFHERGDLLRTGYMLLLGAAVEYIGVWSGQWSYPGEPAGGVPLWFVPMWAGVGFFAGRLLPFPNARREPEVRTSPQILLVNSLSPRRRSLSDVFLDNGTAMLRAHLESCGFRVAVEDRSVIGGLDAFSPRWMTRVLRRLSLRLLTARETGRSTPVTKAVFFALQEALTAVQNLRSRGYIRSIVARVRRERIPVVGVKVWYGNAFIWSKRLVTRLRRACPEVIAVAGGPHANLYNEDGAILRYSNFDLAVYGEGEHALSAILRAARQGRNREERLARIHEMALPNLIWRDDDRVVVNPAEKPQIERKPVPDYRGLCDGKVRVHTLVDALGCDYNRCTFCPHKNIYQGYCRRSVSAIVDEMEAMTARGIAIFRFAAGDTPRHHALAIAREIGARSLTVEFSMFHRATCGAHTKLDRLVTEYRTLIRAGLRAIFMGLETGDDRTNREMLGKNLSSKDVIWSVRAIQRAREAEGRRCDVALSMIHPVPSNGLSWNALRDRTRAVVLEARPDSALVTPPCAFPGTDWFARPEHYGFEIGPDFVEQLMDYEFVLYKPTDLWPNGVFGLDGRGTRDILAESMRLRAEFERAGIQTDIGDENFLILQASEEDVSAFKRQSLADILSCDYRYSRHLYAALDTKSARLASRNRKGRPRTLRQEVPAPVLQEVLP